MDRGSGAEEPPQAVRDRRRSRGPRRDGVSDFNALHSRKQNHDVQLCAFDVLAIDGDDLRDLPLSMRKTKLDRLLRGRPDGIFISHSSKVRLDLAYSAPPATWASRVWCPSAPTARIVAGGHLTGSRSRTGSITPLGA